MSAAVRTPNGTGGRTFAVVAGVAPMQRVPRSAEVVGEVVGREGRFEIQAELAEAVGVSRCLVSRVVRGLR